MGEGDCVVHPVAFPRLGQHILVTRPLAEPQGVALIQLEGRLPVEDPVSQELADSAAVDDAVTGVGGAGEVGKGVVNVDLTPLSSLVYICLL